MLRIAFGCQSRVGKDTACAYLRSKYGGVTERFAKPLYDILHFAQDTLGFERRKDTKFLQFIGTEWARTQDPDVWARALILRLPPDEHVFVSDLRFANELAALKKEGFICVRIDRPGRPIDRDPSHQSEVDLLNCSDWDAIIINEGSPGDLHRQLDVLVETIKFQPQYSADLK